VTPIKTEGSLSERLRGAIGAWHAAVTDDRATRATLRRAQNLDEVPLAALADLATRVLGRVGDDPTGLRRTEQLARVALVVGEIDHDTEHGLGRALRRVRRPLSEERLRLLLDTPEIDLFVRLLRGALVQVERRGPLAATATLILDWHYPTARARARRKLALDYFQADLDDAAAGDTP
jgi:CRISPR type I-E-associated protein CasB/Cse2